METEHGNSTEFDPVNYPEWAFHLFEDGVVTHEVLEDMKSFPNEASYHIETDLRLLEEDVASSASASSVAQDLELLMADISEARAKGEEIEVGNLDIRLSTIRDYLRSVS